MSPSYCTRTTADPAEPRRASRPSTWRRAGTCGPVHPDDSSDDPKRIGGFDPSTGALRWERRPGGSLQSLAAHRGRLLALHHFGSVLTVLDADDGRVVARRRLRSYGPGLLRATGDRFAVIDGSGRDGPLRMYRWR